MTNCKFCQTPISQHEAGRKTDICVTSIMHPEQTDLIKGMGNIFLQGNGKTVEIPCYSTDLNHAIKLWHNDKWNLYNDKGGKWSIDFLDEDGALLVEAGTPALAICRAYLIEKMKEGK